jgi:hypothetical protein
MESTYSIYSGYRKKHTEVPTNMIKFEYLKDKCNLTNEEVEKFKNVLALILTIESRYHVIMDDHGNSAYGAVILGQDDKGVLVFRKYGHICGDEHY